MNKIRRSDRAIVRTSRDKDKQGTMLAVLAEHMMVESVSTTKEHTHPSLMSGTTGGVVDKVTPIHISSITLVGTSGKPSCVGARVEDGMETRVLKTTGVTIGI